MEPVRRLPSWLKRRLGSGETFSHTCGTIKDLSIETICTNANCPNQGECWSRGTATVLILGNICTRNCKFCSVQTGKPNPVDQQEPDHVAQLAKRLGIKYLVITSVDRDDLADGGAAHFRDVMLEARRVNPEIRFEILTPDFKGSQENAIEVLSEALPFVFSHNIETVRELYSTACAGADYDLSLEMLKKASEGFADTPIKSSLMLGLGETDDQVLRCLDDLLSVGVERVSMGQYLQPSRESLPVAEFVTPEKFDWWKNKAYEMGFSWAMASPFTRSSYHAETERP